MIVVVLIIVDIDYFVDCVGFVKYFFFWLMVFVVFLGWIRECFIILIVFGILQVEKCFYDWYVYQWVCIGVVGFEQQNCVMFVCVEMVGKYVFGIFGIDNNVILSVYGWMLVECCLGK